MFLETVWLQESNKSQTLVISGYVIEFRANILYLYGRVVCISLCSLFTSQLGAIVSRLRMFLLRVVWPCKGDTPDYRKRSWLIETGFF